MNKTQRSLLTSILTSGFVLLMLFLTACVQQTPLPAESTLRAADALTHRSTATPAASRVQTTPTSAPSPNPTARLSPTLPIAATSMGTPTLPSGPPPFHGGDAIVTGISQTGAEIAFTSNANHFIQANIGYSRQLYIFDRQTKEYRVASISSQGVPGNGDTITTSLSQSGRYVVFSSWADNLVPADTNQDEDVFLHDLQTGTTERVSVSSTGEAGNAPSFFGQVSSDGRFVVFESVASNLVSKDTHGERNVFLRDRQTGATSLISRSKDGAVGDQLSYHPVITPDGRWIAFFSYASNLTPEDQKDCSNEYQTASCGDIFLLDRSTNALQRIIVGEKFGGEGGASFAIALSADGRFIAYHTYDAASHDYQIFRYDRQNKLARFITLGHSPSISADGQKIAFATYDQVFLFNNETGETMLISKAPDGTPGDAPSGIVMGGGFTSSVVLSSNGEWLAYSSVAGNITPGVPKDPPNCQDFRVIGDGPTCYEAYLYDVNMGENAWISKPILKRE